MRAELNVVALVLLTSFAAASANAEPTTLDFTRVNPGSYELAAASGWRVEIWAPHGAPEKSDAELRRTKFKLASEHGRSEFRLALENLAALAELQKNDPAYKKGEFHLGGEARKSFAEMRALLDAFENADDERTKNDALVHIGEISSAFLHTFLPPLPRQDLFLDGGAYLLGDRHKVGIASNPAPAQNLAANGVDPIDSSFWQKPKAPLAAGETYYGFGRRALPELRNCEYSGPKRGTGIHGGFKIECDGQKWKVKLGIERSVAPFNSRILSLLGFHTIPHDFVPALELPYFNAEGEALGRRLIAEYNSRQDVFVEATVLFGLLRVTKINIQSYLDPFADALAGAVLEDGTRIDAGELRRRLLLSSEPGAEKDAANFNAEFEKHIARLVLRPAAVETVDKKMEELGSWDWNAPANKYRRDMRGFGLLAAWLDMFDMRRDNTTLVLDRRDGKNALLHVVGDVGSGLGQAMAKASQQSTLGTKPIAPRTSVGVANDFDWEFTAKGACEAHCHLQVLGYESLEPVEAYYEMGWEDARWMARQIGGITENQLKLALIAAGFSGAEVTVYTEKLISRRDKLVRDLGLQGEISLLRPTGANRAISYDPATDAPVEAKADDGSTVTAPGGGMILEKGVLKPHP